VENAGGNSTPHKDAQRHPTARIEARPPVECAKTQPLRRGTRCGRIVAAPFHMKPANVKRTKTLAAVVTGTRNNNEPQEPTSVRKPELVAVNVEQPAEPCAPPKRSHHLVRRSQRRTSRRAAGQCPILSQRTTMREGSQRTAEKYITEQPMNGTVDTRPECRRL